MDENGFLAEIDSLARSGSWSDALMRILAHFRADSGTIHLLHGDGLLHLQTASAGIPDVVLNVIRTVPIGKGMAGLAVQRKQPVDACNIQTDTSGDVRPGAKATGLQGSLVVPLLRAEAAVGALGIATQHERTFSAAETALLMKVGEILGNIKPVM